MKRIRGTAIIIRDGKLLLVKECGNNHYSLPGGGHKRGEPYMCTAIREVKEELRLEVRRGERLRDFDFESAHYHQKVSLLTTDQEPVINSPEICDFIWWHPESDHAVSPSTRRVWEKIAGSGLLSRSADTSGAHRTAAPSEGATP
jgi:ADP-ribose pyrophosphatase YjhB (NUDIX family)